jgi:hypothetical protein
MKKKNYVISCRHPDRKIGKNPRPLSIYLVTYKKAHTIQREQKCS